MFWIHFKKVDTIILSENSLTEQAIHGTIIISSSNRFFWWSVTVKSWIPSTIHCIQPSHYTRNTKGYRTEASLWGTRAELELSFIANSAVTFQRHDLQRCHKQAGFHISPRHQVVHAEFKIHSLIFWILSLFVISLITQKWMLCWSVVRLKRKDNIISSGSKSLFLYWFCLAFQLP